MLPLKPLNNVDMDTVEKLRQLKVKLEEQGTARVPVQPGILKQWEVAVAHCQGKKAFSNRLAAESFKDNMDFVNNRKAGIITYVYCCIVCDHWHFTKRQPHPDRDAMLEWHARRMGLKA